MSVSFTITSVCNCVIAIEDLTKELYVNDILYGYFASQAWYFEKPMQTGTIHYSKSKEYSLMISVSNSIKLLINHLDYRRD